MRPIVPDTGFGFVMAERLHTGENPYRVFKNSGMFYRRKDMAPAQVMEGATTHAVTEGHCPVCAEPCTFVAGRGFCTECFVTFPQPRPNRKELLSAFQYKYYVSKISGVYHREGCKYLKNVSPENLIITTEPYGRACGCVKR